MRVMVRIVTGMLAIYTLFFLVPTVLLADGARPVYIFTSTTYVLGGLCFAGLISLIFSAFYYIGKWILSGGEEFKNRSDW